MQGLYFVRVFDDESIGDESVAYGLIVSQLREHFLVRYWMTRENQPEKQMMLETIEQFADEAKFFDSLEDARAAFIELTRDHNDN